MRNRSEHDPPMIRPHTRPSRNRRTAEHIIEVRDGLCMEKHRVSCVCYLSKTHFVRDFLQNSISNSSTSTTCNAILTLSLTNSFPDILKVTITVCQKLRKEGLYIILLHLDLPRLYLATRRHPMEPRTQLLCAPLF